jgi:GTP-binding protein
LIEETPPPSKKGKYIRIKYVTQLKSKKVAFAFFCNLPQYVQESYKRFLEKKIREKYDFQGVPLLMLFKKK